MHIPIEFFKSFRATVAVCLALIGFCVYRYYKETLPKEQLPHVEGKITYIDKRLGNNPNRDLGLYRYVIVDGYRYPFEIYIEEQQDRGKFDSLKTGDVVRVYMIDEPADDSLNRLATRIEKNNKPYFIKSNFTAQVYTFLVGFLFSLCIFCYFLYKKGKLNY